MSNILTTKIHIPKARSNLVLRPRLTKQLLAGMERKLSLIIAPTGFGKTTILSEWIPQSERCVTWVSLDDEDNDPVRFWVYFISAMQMLDAEIGKNALVLLQSPQPPPIEAILTILLNEIAAFPDNFALVLDNYQVIQAKSIHVAIRFILDHLPPHMHLIISTRTDPPLLLGRLRARDQLNEIRFEDLRFTPNETAAFLNQSMGLNLSKEQIISLETHTEGWIAGLQLAGLALQSHVQQPDDRSVSEFIQAFTGSHPYIVSYLVEEVFSQQPKETMDFLQQTSILDSLSGPLCDYLLGESSVERHDNERSGHNHRSSILDSQSILEQLDHANLFIVPLDEEGKWYRYHQLFAEALQYRLKMKTPERYIELHLRASEWYEQAGLIPEAVRHASVAREWKSGARLVDMSLARLKQARGEMDGARGIIENHCLRTRAFQVMGDHDQTRKSLKQAMTLAIPEVYIRTFADEGEPMRRSLIANFRTLTKPLSEREQAVLRLIASGASNAEIAQTLIIALSTVKRHTGNLYRKLEVSSRTQAIVRAKRLNLLS